MKNILLTLVLAAMAGGILAQKFYTKEGEVSFYSDAPMEKIEAQNNKATAILDTETGRIEFAILIKAFQFEKSLMQEHFNENYMESDSYPKSTFKGNIKDWENVDLSSGEMQEVTVKGDLTIHGVTKEVETTANIQKEGDNIEGKCQFKVAVEDYDIKIPSVVKDNIAKEVDINISIILVPLSKS